MNDLTHRLEAFFRHFFLVLIILPFFYLLSIQSHVGSTVPVLMTWE